MAKKVLLTYFESGMGHITSIQSIRDSLAKFSPAVDIVESRVMREGNDKKMIEYENFIIKNTQLTNSIKGYGNMWFSVLGAFGLNFFRLLHKTTFRKATNGVLEYFESQDPDVIVSTHYYMTYCALEYKKLNPDVKVVTYNPDNNVHMWWDNRDGAFFVNNEIAYRQAIDKHFAKERVFQVPCAARKCILDSVEDKAYYRAKYDLPDKFTVTIADGAYAKAKADIVTSYLLNTDRELSVIFVAGKNEKMYDKYVAISHNLPKNVSLRVLPFTADIHEYYCASDVLICKGGPNAVLDSVYMHTPVIIDYYAHPIEKATVDYFVDSLGCGRAIYSPMKIKRQIEQWIDDPSLLQGYVENTYKLDKRDNGADKIASYIMNC